MTALTKSNTEPHPVDIFVGHMLRKIRTAMKVSQEEMGEAVGITFQQIQKYEKGINRISCSRLVDLANFLRVPVSYFFDKIPPDYSIKTGDKLSYISDNASPYHDKGHAQEMAATEIEEVILYFNNIKNKATRNNIMFLLKKLSEDN